MSRKLEMKWGLIFVFTQLIWMIGEKLLGFHDDKIELHPIVSNFFMIPAILVYVLALKKKRNLDYGGSITYKQSFISGLVISLVVTLLAPLTQYVTSTIITPDYFGNVIAYSVEKKLMNSTN